MHVCHVNPLQARHDVRAAASEVDMLTEANRLMGARVVELEVALQVGRLWVEYQMMVTKIVMVAVCGR